MRGRRTAKAARPAAGHAGRLPAFAVFFPAAAFMAVAAVAVQSLPHLRSGPAPPLHLPPLWHGHEMVFGYAFAVVGGYLLTRPDAGRTLLAFAAWLAGRAAMLADGWPPALSAAVALAFPVLLFLFAGLPFLKAAKSPRNLIFAPILAAFAVAELLYHLGAAGVVPDGGRRGLLLAMGLILLLIHTMGGRVIAAATSGAHQARGRKLAGVAQPRSEAAGAACLAASAVLDALDAAPGLAGALAVAAGLLVGWRLVQWRVWRVVGIREVAVLHLGFAWIGLGLLLKGYAQITGALPVLEALHLAMIGGLGTLSLGIMARTAKQRARQGTAMPAILVGAVALVSLTALARIAAFSLPEIAAEALVAAAVAWSLAFLAFAGVLLKLLGDSVRSR